MKVLQSLRGHVQNNSEGTTVRPSLVSVTQGKTRVYIFTIKIGEFSYECVQHSNCNKWRTFRCKNYRKANANGDQCPFKMKVKNISGLTPKENSAVFWRTQSWQVLENATADHHCCTGIKAGIGIKAGSVMETSTLSQMPKLGLLPDVALSRILSFLSIKELLQMRTVSHQFESLANFELKSFDDWRLDYIEKNNPDDETVFDVWRRFSLSKDKLSSWAEKEIEISPIPDSEDFSKLKMAITEDFLVYNSNDNHSIEVFNRREQTTLSFNHRVKWELIKLKNDTVMAARRNGPLFHMKLWKVDGTQHQEVSFHLKLSLKIPLSKFDVNGDVVIIENIRGEVELWSIQDMLPKAIPLPSWDCFLKKYETDDVNEPLWAVGQREEVLVALFDTECESTECESPIDCNQFKFALVFKNLPTMSPSRITFPKKDHVIKVSLTDIDVGNGRFKTVMVAECTTKGGHYAKSGWDITKTRYYYHIYDLDTGKLVETISNDGRKSGISGSFVFPTTGHWIRREDELEDIRRILGFKELERGLDISRINWNGSKWSISTHFIKYPNVGNKYTCGAISNVTDTLVTWNTCNTIGDLSKASFVVCDFLLC